MIYSIRSNKIILFCYKRLIFYFLFFLFFGGVGVGVGAKAKGAKIAKKLLSTFKTKSPSSVIMKTLLLKVTIKLLSQFSWFSWIPLIHKFTSSKKLWNIVSIHTSYEYINKIWSPWTCEKIKNKNWPQQNSNFSTIVFIPINGSFKAAWNKIFEAAES